ncbi:hypothetical protein [Paenibacillus silvisoli]|uniref:hypothetical protein n=1 Tax=Paenibacillus silvisoli TaxID=3110539 RepID=UPI002805E99F|nr:hypothetical protein [Paenibacillus silvisoli]
MPAWLRWTILLPLGFAAGIYIGLNDFSVQKGILLLGVFLLAFALFGLSAFHTVFRTQNTGKVEAYLRRTRARHPQNGLVLDAANGDFDAVERAIPRICNKMARTSALVSLHLERQELAQAQRIVDEVQPASNRNYYKALISILEGDFQRAEEYKAGIRSKALQHVIDAEIAFKQGKPEEADQAGQLALAAAGGVQKFVLMRSLERQRSNPSRRMYF